MTGNQTRALCISCAVLYPLRYPHAVRISIRTITLSAPDPREPKEICVKLHVYLQAGTTTDVGDLASCLSYHTLAEEVDAILPQRLRRDGEQSFPPQPPRSETRDGYYTKVRSLVSPGRQGALGELLAEARSKMPGQALPQGIDPLRTVFGRPTGVTKSSDAVDEVVFPKRPFGETRLVEELGLELYQRSHNHYLVGQRRDLKYEVPAEVIYGKINSTDRTGLLTKKSLKWFNQESVSRTSKGQARVRETSHYELGKALTPNGILKAVGEERVFGKVVSMDDTGAREGMRQGPVDKSHQLNGEYLGFLCQIRRAIKKKDPPFPFFDLVSNLNLLDQGGCGCLPLDLVYEVCERLGLFFDREMLGIVLRHIGVIHGEKDDTVSYHGFCNILDIRQPLPQFPKVDDLTEDMKFYESTYQAQAKDLERKNEYGDAMQVAGVPTLRTDRVNPGEAGCRGNRFLLVDETTVDSCIRPSIFSFYGLTPRDFLQPRSKEYMRDLWKRVGLDIPDNIFDEMWKEGLTREENDGTSVSIETFRNMLDEMCEAKLVEVRES